MGEVVNLRDFSRVRPGDIVVQPGRAAEILFFTGVRYQKHADMAEMAVWTDPQDGAGPGTSRKRKRRA